MNRAEEVSNLFDKLRIEKGITDERLKSRIATICAKFLAEHSSITTAFTQSCQAIVALATVIDSLIDENKSLIGDNEKLRSALETISEAQIKEAGNENI